jgi:hypothetical protein
MYHKGLFFQEIAKNPEQKGAAFLLKKYGDFLKTCSCIQTSPVMFGLKWAWPYHFFSTTFAALQNIKDSNSQSFKEELAHYNNLGGISGYIKFTYDHKLSMMANLNCFLQLDDHKEFLNSCEKENHAKFVIEIKNFRKDIQEFLDLNQGIAPKNLIERHFLLERYFLLKCILANVDLIPKISHLMFNIFSTPYILVDEKGNNTVHEVIYTQGEFHVKGANTDGQECSIIIDNRGTPRNGHNGTSKLGVVENQMYQNWDNIKFYFNVNAGSRKPMATPEQNKEECRLM